MGDVVMSSFRLNGFGFRKEICLLPSSRGCKTCSDRGFSCANLAFRIRITRVGLCERDVACAFMKKHSSSGCTRIKMSLLSIRNGWSKNRIVFAISSAFGIGEPGLASPQGERDGVDEKCLGQFLPPWGSMMVDTGQVAERVVQPLKSSDEMVMVDEVKVHLLEESGEEELSRRILALSRSNKVRSALELFRSMEVSGLLPNSHACNSLLSCLVRNEYFENAMRIFDFMMINDITTSHTYSLVLRAVADAQGCDAALKIFTEWESCSKGNIGFDVVVYNTMISVCGKVNNWVETERLWRSMKGNGYSGTQITYSLLVSIFVRCGQYELAFDAYSEMIQHGVIPRDDAMKAIIGASTKEGKWEFALNIFESMLQYGMKPTLATCNALINSLGKAGEAEKAFEVFERAKSLGHTPDSYTWNALLGALYRANQHASSIELFESIKEDQTFELNEHLYNTALMSCQKLGLWEKAIQLLWQLETSGLSVSAASCNLVIGACETARKPKVALQVYQHMVHQNCTPDTFTHLSLIRSCVWASLWGEVEDILDKQADDASLYNAAIHGMCLRGKVDSAKQLYMKMRKNGLKPDGKTRALMLQNLRKISTR